MSKSYRATILGTDREVCGFNAKGNLTLADCEEFVVIPLNMQPETFRSPTIREISKLIYSGSGWLLDGKPLDKAWFPETRRRFNARSRTNVFTLWKLCRLLGVAYPGSTERNAEQLAELQKSVVAVAWTQERFDDYPEQEAKAGEQETTPATDTVCIPAAKAFEPVLLTAFYSIGKTLCASSDVRAKPVAHFENGYTVAVIPLKGDEVSLTVETELRELIKRIIEAGGQMPRTKLCEGKPSYQPDQPEKLLKSQTAKKLITAKLLGTTRSGRTTTFWAKAE